MRQIRSHPRPANRLEPQLSDRLQLLRRLRSWRSIRFPSRVQSLRDEIGATDCTGQSVALFLGSGFDSHSAASIHFSARPSRTCAGVTRINLAGILAIKALFSASLSIPDPRE